MEIKPADVKQVILDEDDFGHEMRVGRVLADLGDSRKKDRWNSTDVESPRHGGTYTDSVTGKPRQFDYRCRIIRREFPGHATCALLAIECKNLHKSSPLVICGRERTDAEAYYGIIESTYNEDTKVALPRTKRANGQPFYKAGEFVGKSLLRLKEKSGMLVTDTNSDIYDRWAQALASSIELAQSACWAADKLVKRYSSVVLPIVVVPNDSLWSVTYDNAGSILQDPVTVRQCEYFVERKFGAGGCPFVLTHIHFVTISGLSDFLSVFWSHQRAWECIFPAGASEMTLEDNAE